MDQNGTRYLVVPEADQPMDDYYAALQISCDAGDRPDLREPAAVALAFEEAWSGRDLSLEAFQVEGPCGLDELWNLPLAVAEVGPYRGGGRTAAHVEERGAPATAGAPLCVQTVGTVKVAPV